MVKTAEMPELSIIVPTYHRVAFLTRLLEALINQTADRRTFEVIVVDNDPSQDSQVLSLCKQLVHEKMNLFYIHHPIIGTSEARNRGIKKARAELLGFLDDDSLPEPEWVEKVIRVFSETKTDILGGPYRPYYLSDKPHWFRDYYAGKSYGDKPCWLIDTRTVWGLNMAFRKKVIETVGGFSTQYGYFGNRKIYGEETELNLRSRHAGFTTWFEPSLMIRHYADPKRMRPCLILISYWQGALASARMNYTLTLKQDQRPKYRVALSLLRGSLEELIKCLSLLLLAPFRNKMKYPFVENYLIECFGSELSRFGHVFGQFMLTLPNRSEKPPRVLE
jgi:glucosyl-dolichyl phosphate glucuronosyltransferase